MPHGGAACALENSGPVNLLLVALALAVGDPTAADDDMPALKISVGGAESLAVTISGPSAGPPVVLIPGLFSSYYTFRKVVPRLIEAGYRTIVIEPLGVGSSSGPARADYSLAAQAERIARVLDALHVDSAIVVAHGLAASMILRLAYHRPDLVRGLVSLDGGPSEAAATPSFRRTLRLLPWAKMFGGMRLIRRKTREMMVTASGDTTWVTDSVVARYTPGLARDLDGTLKTYIAMGSAREPEPLAPHLSEVPCPVRLLVGSAPHGGHVTDADLAVLQKNLRAFAVDSIAGAGHYLQEERPELVVAAVVRLQVAMAR